MSSMLLCYKVSFVSLLGVEVYILPAIGRASEKAFLKYRLIKLAIKTAGSGPWPGSSVD